MGVLNLTQASFDNWAQGGENNFAWQLDLSSKFIYEQTTINWSNLASVSFGKIKVSNQDSRKTVDDIRLQSVMTRKVSKLLNPYAAVTFGTQLKRGYDYTNPTKVPISDFVDPAYFSQSMGMGYAPNQKLKARLGAALKETITDKYNKYADNPKTVKIEKKRLEVGIESVTNVQKNLGGSLVFTSELWLFSGLEGYNKIDVKWDGLFSAQVAKYVNVRLNGKIFYDRDVSAQRQVKQVLAIGLTYHFI